MTVWIEPPEGWAPARILATQLERLGYHVAEHRINGRSLLAIAGSAAAAQRL